MCSGLYVWPPFLYFTCYIVGRYSISDTARDWGKKCERAPVEETSNCHKGALFYKSIDLSLRDLHSALLSITLQHTTEVFLKVFFFFFWKHSVLLASHHYILLFSFSIDLLSCSQVGLNKDRTCFFQRYFCTKKIKRHQKYCMIITPQPALTQC